jgi:putative inorganic carbon (HCO3(-)) transporter
MLPAALLSLAQDHRGSVALRIVAGDDSGRFYLWRLALDDAMQHPWLGIGPMHYAHLPNLLAAHPHNSLVQWAAEWGFPVTLGMLVAVCALLQRAVRQVANTTTPNGTTTLLAVAALATIAGGIDSLVSGTLVMPVSQTWWFIALGCMLACLSDRSAHVPVAGSMARWVLIVALLALHVGSSVLTYRRSVEPPQTTATGLQRNNVPRYWINGFF